MPELLHIVLPLIAAVITAPLSAWLMSRLLKEKHETEIAKLKEEVEQMRSDVRSRELDNDKKAMNMLMELVVNPLREDMIGLQNTVKRLTNAINKIPYCPYSDDCPVSHELQSTPTGGVAGATIPARKRPRSRAANTPSATAVQYPADTDGRTADDSEPPDAE